VQQSDGRGGALKNLATLFGKFDGLGTGVSPLLPVQPQSQMPCPYSPYLFTTPLFLKWGIFLKKIQASPYLLFHPF